MFAKKKLRPTPSSAAPTAETSTSSNEPLGYETTAQLNEAMFARPVPNEHDVDVLAKYCAELGHPIEQSKIDRAKEHAQQYYNKKLEANKYDDGKPPLGLIPRSAQVAEAQVLAYGARKYDVHNWRKGMAWSRLVDAALRHLTAWNDGEDTDPESGINHLAHARCCLSFLIEYQEKEMGHDDRHK